MFPCVSLTLLLRQMSMGLGSGLGVPQELVAATDTLLLQAFYYMELHFGFLQ